MTTHTILRLREVRARYPRSRSSIYRDIATGTMTPPVSIGRRCAAWPAREVDAIIAARIAGATEDDIRALVAQLVADRGARS